MPSSIGPKSDAQYRIESDARSLVEAERIKKDKKRLSAARNYLMQEMKATKAAVGKAG